MDSWKSIFLANGTDLPSDSLTNNRKVMAEWDQRLSNDLENDIFISQLPDKSFSDLAAKSFGFNTVSISKVASSCLFPSNLLDDEEEEKEASSNFSSLASQELPRIDFKLSSFVDYSDSKESDLPAKKPRTANSCSQKPLCQVYGCDMDLTSSKDYHKRHRVCEIHSKTAMVIVSGIQQRFCQQCSRFHLLTEFDDGKRSCRRRLAGHNERRRKPSFYFLPGRRHKVLHTSQGVAGNKCLENPMDKDFSLVLPEAFPGKVVKFKDESTCSIFASNGKSSSRIYQWKPVSSSSEETAGLSSIWDIHEASRSSCALSLLSAKSQQISGNQNKTNQNVHSPTDYHQVESLLMDSAKSSSSYRKGSSTVDLLELSLHLQRIEQQRNFTEVKQEYKELYFPDS